MFWTVSFLMSIAGFCFYANGVYLKWIRNPDIALKIKLKSIREIPFPAVTICLPLFAKSNSIKMSSFVDIRNFSISRLLLPEDQSIIGAAAQACNPFVSSRISRLLPKASSEKFIEHLLLTSSTVNEAFGACFYDRMEVNCEKMMNRILFDTGLCYTYNIQGYNTIFRKETISKDFDLYKRMKIAKALVGPKQNETVNDDKPEKLYWTIFNGYESESDEVFPVRAAKNGVVTFYPKVNIIDLPNICLRYGRGFRLILHSPNEIASFPHNEYFIPFNQERQLTIEAKFSHFSEELRIYAPEKRECYFENERKLKFFKSYSKTHCLLECLTTFTLKKCECVKFSMPRDSNTPICNLTKISCYNEALHQWPYADKQDAKTLMPCDCFQPCNDISYSVKLDRTGDFESKIKNISKSALYAEIGIKFNDILIEEQDFFVGYKLQNFIADTGGLLGLFMGCSILSIVELIYYLIKGIYNKYMKYKNKIKKTNFLKRAEHPVFIMSFHEDFRTKMSKLEFPENFRFNDNDIYIVKRPLYERSLLNNN
ncbi:unnamed protein product [Chironomus riparius]|uniref:Uncharacterized protein n=1 Tax=Chironomus riparius TaxID=315576 RepID=A0A9N9S5P6_9DIPT|nr:unnamed protein product [Chironomus riparius]